jgi:hypothetical protein
VTARRLGLAVCCALALSTAPAGSHSGIPQAWWLDQATVVAKLKAREGSSWVSGRCTGLTPRGARAGVAVFKHFSCTAKLRANRINYTFFYRVHVVGPKGRIRVGG